jgi:hypothetical protein
MPQGYYTVEQWTRPRPGAPAEWLPIVHLPFGATQTAAEAAVERLGQPGLYRLVQTQRVVWAEKTGDRLRLRKSHASSPQNLDEIRQTFDRTGGRYPVEEAQAARRRAKKASR